VVDARINISRSEEVVAPVHAGTAEEVSVIDKEGIEPAAGVLKEKSLAIVGVPCANIDHPCEPEAFSV